MGGRTIEKAKAKLQSRKGETARVAADPSSYLDKTPVWRLSDFDWDGAWGFPRLNEHKGRLRKHVEEHLAGFETMTWDEILKASGGRNKGNNNHEIARDKFKPEIVARLKDKNILSDTLFSLRLDAGTRIYGVREGNCLRVIFFDPFHKDHEKSAYLYD